MKPQMPKLVTALSMVVALAAGVAGGTATAADMMQNNPENTGKAMDYNKDGRIDRYEFVRYQGRMFDQMAGTKGYATYADVSKMMKDFGSVFPLDNSKD
jgi:hypothetical protein